MSCPTIRVYAHPSRLAHEARLHVASNATTSPPEWGSRFSTCTRRSITGSFAIGLEIAEHVKRHCPNHDSVYKPEVATHSVNRLEESLATAESYRRPSEAVYSRRVPADLRKPARRQLQTWIRSLPPGYNSAPTSSEPRDVARRLQWC